MLEVPIFLIWSFKHFFCLDIWLVSMFLIIGTNQISRVKHRYISTAQSLSREIWKYSGSHSRALKPSWLYTSTSGKFNPSGGKIICRRNTYLWLFAVYVELFLRLNYFIGKIKNKTMRAGLSRFYIFF